MGIDKTASSRPKSSQIKGQLDAILLQPPPGDLTGPYPALAYLKASACRDGYNVQIRDLGIEALRFLTERNRLRALLRQAEALRMQFEAKSVLTTAELHLYTLLVSAMGLGLKPGLVRSAMADLKDPVKFYDYRLYKRACRILESFHRLLSAIHYPTLVTPSEYPVIHEMRSYEEVLAHCRRSLNPYVSYYEEVLFPQLADAAPSLIGISMVFASQSVQALVLARLLKERFPEAHILMGGAYLSQWVLLMDEQRLLDLFAYTDAVICGEGEGPFVELLSRVSHNRSWEGTPNLIHLDRRASRLKRFLTMEYTDLSHLPPPDYSDLDLDAYLTPELVIPYCISRGCYWGRCAFCQNRYGDQRMRRYQTVPVEKAVSEMAALAEMLGSHHFNFSNDAIDPAYLKRFCDAVESSGKKFVWNTDLRAEKAFTPEACRQLSGAGLNCVAIGFESGCRKTLEAIDKGYEVESMRQVMKSFYDAGVAVQAMGIFGFPGETEKDGELTVRFLEENVDCISYYVMGLLMVLPGSRMYKDPRKYGITSIRYENNPMMTPEPVWRSDTRMSARSVNELYRRLSRLEEVYAINDYPYAGGLSTNHTFLYFKLGPDILKRLRADENQQVHRLRHMVGGNDAQLSSRRLKSIVPRPGLPFTLYPSRFPLEQAAVERPASEGERAYTSGAKQDYLVDPVNVPYPNAPALLKFLRRVDGRRNLQSVLSKMNRIGPLQAFSFLAFLVDRDLLDVPQQ
jgi:anaerobic magnesium-protoporphyrin IX monomethyl ester cyclase